MFAKSCVSGLVYGRIAENAVFLDIWSSVIQTKGTEYAKKKKDSIVQLKNVYNNLLVLLLGQYCMNFWCNGFMASKVCLC